MDITEEQASALTETTPLAQKKGVSRDQAQTSCVASDTAFNPYSVLPISFLAALGMAATAATSIFAYATILCRDPKHCQGSEQRSYASSVAIAVTIANICSMLVLSSLEKILRTYLRVGIALWIVCRSMSVVMLGLGVYFHSIKIALSGRIFEGLASDNLLHFTLNTIYVRTAPNEAHISRLIGASLALFMTGISISPAIAGVFQNLMTSFLMAGAIFVFSLFYLVTFVGERNGQTARERDSSSGRSTTPIPSSNRYTLSHVRRKFLSLFTAVISPLKLFSCRPASTMSGIALFIYTSVQSYIFSLIMVHTSLVFGFTGKQNGWLLSIVHATAASYLFLVLYTIPRLKKHYLESIQQSTQRNPQRDAKLALISLFIQILALLGFANASQTWQIYIVSTLLALGLATPSFIKSHFLEYFEREKGGSAMGALAMMETGGALISPLLLGTWQSMRPGAGVFYVAACMMAISTGFFSIAVLVLNWEVEREETRSK